MTTPSAVTEPGTGAETTEPEAKGYPDNTPVEQMTPEQQAAYWKTHSRTWEGRAKQAPTPQELAELREKAEKFDKHHKAQMTELERAQTTIADLTAKVASHDLAEMRRQAAKAAGLPTDDAEFITATTAEDAKAQAERLKQRLGSGTSSTSHDQGHRRQATTSSREAGLAEAQRRFGKTTQTA